MNGIDKSSVSNDFDKSSLSNGYIICISNENKKKDILDFKVKSIFYLRVSYLLNSIIF